MLPIHEVPGDIVRLGAEESAEAEGAEAAEGRLQCARASGRRRRLRPPAPSDERCSSRDFLRGLCSGCLEFQRSASEAGGEEG